MRQWCLRSLDVADTFYAHPPKPAKDQLARFIFYNPETEMMFAMRYNNGKNNYKAVGKEQ